LRQFYDHLLRSNDAEKQLRYLAIFNRRPLPKIDSEIIALLDSPETKVRRATVIALSITASPIIREIAIKLLNREEDELREYAFALLINNYKEGDNSKIELALTRFTEKKHLHCAGISLKEIAENSKDTALAPALLFLVVNGPDPFCREDFLEILLKWQKCPEAILYEAQWDFYKRVLPFYCIFSAKSNQPSA